MKQTYISFWNEQTGDQREVKTSYSYTVFLFGVLALLFRKQFGMAILFMAVNMVLTLMPPILTLIFRFTIYAIYGAYANEQLADSLLNTGYKKGIPSAYSA